jgi:serine/threonine-protein kinase
MGNIRAISPATDVHGLGTILYELLTGRPAVTAGDPVELIRQVVSVPPVPPRKLAPGVPTLLESICLRCLEKQSTLRYPSAEALADELEHFLSGRLRWIKLGRRLLSWLGRTG